MPDLLIELFSEEIPARMQRRAADDLKKLVTDGVVDAGLTYAGAVAHCTPRRLTLAINGLTDASPTTTEDRKGPRVDAPEKALAGFLRGAGLTKDQLTIADDKKGQIYVARITNQGRPAAAIVADVLDRTIRNFPWPKSMRWGTGSLRWVRPLRSILCILTREDGHQIVPLDVDGIGAGDTTEGHRFMAPGRFSVTSFDDYEAKLKRAKVVLSSQERADAIWQDATNQAFAAGLEVVEDAGLLAEVAGLVEWPVVLMGRIDDAFLDLPPEVLQTSMKEHQKFFSVRDKTGKIVRFVTVANRDTADDGATILAGNNRVLSARLADAKFFWENDLRVAKEGMEQWTDALANVTFHAKLGSQAERIERIAALARELAPTVGADPDLAERAARLAKADLSSEMVYEFPELQGLMGRYYADAANLPKEIGLAAQEHYSPLGPSDDVPTAPVSVAVALADKLDTLAGFWAIDEKPTGSKDPYALRRAALGVIRLVLENGVSLLLARPLFVELAKIKIGREHALEFDASEAVAEQLRERQGHLVSDFRNKEFEKRHAQHRNGKSIAESEALALDLLTFLHDRLKQHLKSEDIRHDVIDAVLTGDRTDDLANVTARARALNAFLATDDGENLLQGYKRAKNILDQAEAKDGVEYSYGADPKMAETEEERALFDAMAPAKPAIEAALAAEDYPAAMAALADLRAPIDAFFEGVQVNAESQVVRRNRLNLLSEIVRLCAQIADLSKIGS
ncbi:glycine--tRNA ligase subunit beta [Jannaschia donghaensis]|uniref:Glycine--tRNA ligase beta subunit n=1 Tax=Jannaschia donghaensis TaxID=420998 RepID=A0A0M6YLL4_9RHOB|nr:glycine--tRNA ligase subunit beta [Jannaschia donghaensis]CTQ50167.1 Glycine--tRNA ligase beta subunit [Jannaschia donghaensis]